MAVGERIDTIRLVGKGRISTVDEKGSNLELPAAHPYGEGFELRYNPKTVAGQFQAIFVRVTADADEAQTGTIRGAEYDARNETNQNSATVMGLTGTAGGKGT